MIQIAILGFGVVGSGTAEVLTQNCRLIEKHCGEEVHVKYILDLREFPDHPLGDRVVHDINVILGDPEVRIVAEMMGGSHPAYEFTRGALEAGKSVVTSNKEVVATYGAELLALARENNAFYLFEASVGGGIPIIRPLQTDLVGNEILSVSGILNGTTNFILTKMKNEGSDFASALKEEGALDGLCGKTDEENLGFTYAELDIYIRTGKMEDAAKKELIDRRHRQNLFKLQLMPSFKPEF